MATHRHIANPQRNSEHRGFVSGVAQRSRDIEPRAHGGIVYTEYCDCGSSRKVASNGRYNERSLWTQKRELIVTTDCELAYDDVARINAILRHNQLAVWWSDELERYSERVAKDEAQKLIDCVNAGDIRRSLKIRIK